MPGTCESDIARPKKKEINKNFADIIKLKILRWGDYPGFLVGPYVQSHVSLLDTEKKVLWSRERFEYAALDNWNDVARIQGMLAATRIWKR